MRGQQYKESKVMVKTSTFRSEVMDDQIQVENPENNFQKLMSLQQETPAKQFRNIIQSMLENCTFQKNIIKKTSEIQVPNYVKTQINRREVFDGYVTIKNYANFLRKKRHFQARKFTSIARKSYTEIQTSSNLSKTPKNRYKHDQKHRQLRQTPIKQSFIAKPTNLLQFVESKKKKMLLEDNIIKLSYQKVNNILNDNKKRQKIFQQALFLQRLYDIQIQKLKNVGVSQATYQVPEKFKGIDPRHIRISSEIFQTQQQYQRKKYVCKKRKLQFYGHARKIEQSSLKTKKFQNLGVLSTIMSFNQAKTTSKVTQVKQNTKSNNNYMLESTDSGQRTINLNTYQQDLKIKRLFLKYTCCQSENPEQMYKYLGQKQINEFFKDFDLQEKKVTNTQLYQFLQKKKQEGFKLSKTLLQKQPKIKYFLFDFLQILYILASDFSSDKSTTKLSSFLQSEIWPKQNQVMPQHWLKLKRIKKSQRMTKFIRMLKLSQKAQFLFDNKSKKNVKNQSQFSSPLLSFDDVLQITWELKIFPLKISKKALRFIYLYCKSFQNGVNQQDFLDLLIIIGLKFAPIQDKSMEQKIKWISEQIMI